HTRFSRDWSSDVCSSDLHAKTRRIEGRVVRVRGTDHVHDAGVIEEDGALRVVVAHEQAHGVRDRVRWEVDNLLDLLEGPRELAKDRKSTRLNSSHVKISY